MSGAEIFGIIANIIAITETCIVLYNAIKDIDDLPAAFKEVDNRLPLINQTLGLVKPLAESIPPGEEADAVKKVLTACKKKSEHLREIFEAIQKKFQRKHILEVYRKVVLKLKSEKVETLASNILKDLQTLDTYTVFKGAVSPVAEQLRKAQEDLAAVEASLPDSPSEDSAATIINHGRDQFFTTGSGNVVRGDQYESHGNQYIDNRILTKNLYMEFNSHTMVQTLHNLPAIDINPFVQRHGVLRDLRQSFIRTSEWDSRSVTIVLHGVGGQGKTQIVLNLCQSSWARTQFHNIFWINAASRKTTEDSFSQIAIEISRLHKYGSGYLNGERFRSEVKHWDTTWLFVFDNYDNEQGFSIQEFIPQSPKGSVLITTRLSGLQIGRKMEMPGMTEEEALELLLYDPTNEQRNAEDREEGKRLVHMLEFHALAIDQARGWCTAHGIHSYREAFTSHRAEIINQRGRAQDQTWSTTFEISLKPFKQQENILYLLTLSAFMGRATIWGGFFQSYSAIHSKLFTYSDLSGETTKTWDEERFHAMVFHLGQRSLVRVRQNRSGPQAGTFYSLHSVVREWLQLRQSSLDRKEFVHAAIMMMAAFVDAHLDCPPPFQVQLDIFIHLDSLQEQDADNFIYSSSSPNERGKITALVLASFYRRCGRINAAQTMLNKLLDHRRDAGIDDSNSITIDVRLEIGETYVNLSTWEKARKCATELLNMSALSERQRCQALLILAKAEVAGLYLSEGEEKALQASEIAKCLPNGQRLIISTELLLTWIEGSRGFAHKAIGRVNYAFEVATKTWGERDPSTLEAGVMKSIVEVGVVPPGDIKSFIERLINIAEELHGRDHWLTLQAILALGRLSLRSGYFEEARMHLLLVQSRITDLFGDESMGAVHVRNSLAEVYYAKRQYVEAEKQLHDVIKLSDKMGDPGSHRHALYGLFWVYVGTGRWLSALPLAPQLIAALPLLVMMRHNRVAAAILSIFATLWIVSALRGSFLTTFLISATIMIGMRML